MKEYIIPAIMRRFFYQHSEPEFTSDEIETFEAVYSQAIGQGTSIAYSGPYPKHRLIQYIACHHPVLLHGSNQGGIREFEPRRQTLYNGTYVEAVFAARDGIWPVFYAVFDRSKLTSNFRNACFVVNDVKKFYYFSLARETLALNPWTEGTVYFLPDQSFRQAGTSYVSFAEWVSEAPVQPMTQIKVGPEDFLYLNQVAGHNSKESIVASWFMYKLRIWRSRKR
jgi:hypothetical protein